MKNENNEQKAHQEQPNTAGMDTDVVEMGTSILESVASP